MAGHHQWIGIRPTGSTNRTGCTTQGRSQIPIAARLPQRDRADLRPDSTLKRGADRREWQTECKGRISQPGAKLTGCFMCQGRACGKCRAGRQKFDLVDKISITTHTQREPRGRHNDLISTQDDFPLRKDKLGDFTGGGSGRVLSHSGCRVQAPGLRL